MDTQLKVLKEYDAFAQKKVSEALAVVLQELVEKEQVTDIIMRGLNKQFAIFTDKVHYQKSSRVSRDGPLVSLRGLLGCAP